MEKYRNPYRDVPALSGPTGVARLAEIAVSWLLALIAMYLSG
jgi:hypothetical protein